MHFGKICLLSFVRILSSRKTETGSIRFIGYCPFLFFRTTFPAADLPLLRLQCTDRVLCAECDGQFHFFILPVVCSQDC